MHHKLAAGFLGLSKQGNGGGCGGGGMRTRRGQSSMPELLGEEVLLHLKISSRCDSSFELVAITSSSFPLPIPHGRRNIYIPSVSRRPTSCCEDPKNVGVVLWGEREREILFSTGDLRAGWWTGLRTGATSMTAS